MKSKGFSLIELLLALTLLTILISFGFNSLIHSRTIIEADIDRQFVFKLPVLLEKFFSEKLSYPEDLGELLDTSDTKFLTPKAYYVIAYRRGIKNNYQLTATLNPEKRNTDNVYCAVISISDTGKIMAFDKLGKAIPDTCWK